MTLDSEVVDVLGDEPSLLAIADAIASTQQRSRARPRLRRPAFVAMPLVVLAATLTPIGGASLLHRAANGLGLESTPAAPAPYTAGDQEWTQNPPAGAVIPGATSPTVSYPPAPPAYAAGDQVWSTTPPQDLNTQTVACGTLADAANALAALEQQRSDTNAVACR